MGEKPSTCLKLFGSWASSYTHRVQLALKLKSLEFEYIEEDLANKSPSLLLHNPIHKKVPVLIHNDHAIPESLIILQYIDETWPSSACPLMPSDPYEKSLFRFWSLFVDDKLGPVVGTVFATTGEIQKAAVEQVHENLKLIETEMRDGYFKGRKFFGGEEIGLLDIVLGCGSYWLAVFEEVAEVKLVDSESFPLFHTWLKNFEEQEEVKEIIPCYERLLEYAKGVRQMLLGMNSASVEVSSSSGENVSEVSDASN